MEKYSVSFVLAAFAIIIIGMFLDSDFPIRLANAYNEPNKPVDGISISQYNVTIYVTPPIVDEKILPYSSISPQYISDTISISASPGEFEPSSFVIHTQKDIEFLTIEATDLTGDNGSIPFTNVDIRAVKCWYQAGIGIDDTEHKMLMPELLLKDDSLIKLIGNSNYIKLTNGSYIKISGHSGIRDIPSKPTTAQFPIRDAEVLQSINILNRTNKQFWITIKVPENATAGIYNGKLILKNPSGLIAEIKLRANILPITLCKPYLTYSLYYGGVLQNTGTISSFDKNEEQFRSEMIDLFDHGVTNPTVYYQDYLGEVLKIRDEQYMNNQTLFYLGLTIQDYGNNLSALRSAVDDLESFTTPYNITEIYIYAPDERSLNNSENRGQIYVVHDAGGKVFDAQGRNIADTVSDVLDLAVVSGDPDIQLADKYHSYNHKIFSYANPQAGVEQPETYRRNYGLLLWQRNYDGAMNFAYQWQYHNIWDDFDDARYRDHVFAYPTVNGVIDTIQWEGWREGVDDIRYLTTLIEAIQQAKLAGKDTEDSESWLADLKKTDLEGQDLDDVRASMIEHILSLKGLDPAVIESQ